MDHKSSPPVAGMVLCFEDPYLRVTFARAWAAVTGFEPNETSTSESADRLHYPPTTCMLILNTPADIMYKQLGYHHAVVALIVPDRVAAAEQAAKIFNDAGYETKIHRHAESEFDPDFLVFLQVLGNESILMMFWPRREDVTPETRRPERKPFQGFCASS